MRDSWKLSLVGLAMCGFCAGCATPTTLLHFDFERDALYGPPLPISGSADLSYQDVHMNTVVVPRLNGHALNFESQLPAAGKRFAPFMLTTFTTNGLPDLPDGAFDVSWIEETSNLGQVDIQFELLPADEDDPVVGLGGFSLFNGQVIATGRRTPPDFRSVSPTFGGVHAVVLHVDLARSQWIASFFPDRASLLATRQHLPLTVTGILPIGVHIREGAQLQLLVGYHLPDNTYLTRDVSTMNYYIDDVAIVQESH